MKIPEGERGDSPPPRRQSTTLEGVSDDGSGRGEREENSGPWAGVENIEGDAVCEKILRWVGTLCRVCVCVCVCHAVYCWSVTKQGRKSHELGKNRKTSQQHKPWWWALVAAQDMLP